MSATVARELRTIDRMPYGTARIAAAEMLARKIEADGPAEHLAEALLGLVEAYTFANEGAKSFVVFARLLRLWDDSPELFDAADQRNLFWEFKWVAGDLPDYPQITAAQAEQFLVEMERRFSVAGHGTSSVAMSRFRWAWHAGQPDADAARLAWVTGMRDEFEDCRACTIGQQVDYFTEVGRWDEAVALAQEQETACNLEPTRTHHAAALSALLAGDPARALASHRLALATLDTSDSDFAPARGQSFELLARGGQLELALSLLRNDCSALLTAASTPLFRLRFLLGVLAGLSANLDRGDEPTGLRSRGATSESWETVAALHTWVAGEVDALAASFDARDGTAFYAGLAERSRRATRTERALEMAGVRTADPALDETIVEPEADNARAGDAETMLGRGKTLLGRGESLASQADYLSAARCYDAAAEALEAEGWIERSGFAFAEAGQCASLGGDESSAHRSFGLAVARLRTGEAELDAMVQVLAAWAPVVVRVGDPEGYLAQASALLGGLGAFDDAGLADDLAERRRAEWSRQRASLRDSLARVIASAHPDQRPAGLDPARAVAEALTAGEEFAGLGLISDAAHAFWLAGRIQRGEGLTTEALWSLESAFEGFTVVRDLAHRADAAGELIELLREAGQPERAAEIAEQLLAP